MGMRGDDGVMEKDRRRWSSVGRQAVGVHPVGQGAFQVRAERVEGVQPLLSAGQPRRGAQAVLQRVEQPLRRRRRGSTGGRPAVPLGQRRADLQDPGAVVRRRRHGGRRADHAGGEVHHASVSQIGLSVQQFPSSRVRRKTIHVCAPPPSPFVFFFSLHTPTRVTDAGGGAAGKGRGARAGGGVSSSSLPTATCGARRCPRCRPPGSYPHNLLLLAPPRTTLPWISCISDPGTRPASRHPKRGGGGSTRPPAPAPAARGAGPTAPAGGPGAAGGGPPRWVSAAAAAQRRGRRSWWRPVCPSCPSFCVYSFIM